MGCRQCLPLSDVQLKGKHCPKPHCCNGARTVDLKLNFTKKEMKENIKGYNHVLTE